MNHINEKCKVRTENFKILHFTFYILPFAFLFLSGCVAFQVGGEIKPGRYALLRGDSKEALAHFRRAAEIDPNYVNNFTPLNEGVWTYVGRAYYATGDLSAARKALEQARTRHADDQLATLYLGLVLAKDGDRERGLKELEAGLRGLNDWLDYLELYHTDGRFWDPGRQLRSEIQRELGIIKGKEVNWSEIIAGAEYLGEQFEKEIDEAKRHRERTRDDEDRRAESR